MARMTGGAALVEMLCRHGVDTIFALPGVQNDALFVAFYDAGDSLRIIHTRHEQGAGYMAFGYARATGKIGTFAVVPGPGFLNTTAALATAYATNAPVLCIAGQVPSDMIGRGYGLLHEIPDQLGVLNSLTSGPGASATRPRPANASTTPSAACATAARARSGSRSRPMCWPWPPRWRCPPPNRRPRSPNPIPTGSKRRRWRWRRRNGR